MHASAPILLIDDDRIWLETLADFLQREGFVVRTAENPRRGLALLETAGARVAILDFNMPEVDGLEVLRQIRRRTQQVRVLLLSSEDDARLAARALAEGAVACLCKTTTPRLLMKQLRQALAAATAEPPERRPVVSSILPCTLPSPSR